MKNTKYVSLSAIANAARRYSKKFPNVSESTVCGWLKHFRRESTRKVPSEEYSYQKNVDDRCTCQRN